MLEKDAAGSVASEFTEAMGRVSDRKVQIQQLRDLTLMRVQVDPLSEAAARIRRVLGVPFPAEPGEVSGDDRGLEILYGTRQVVAVLWVRSGTFLVITRVDRLRLGRALNAALGADDGLIVDVSVNHSVIELSGPEVHAVLERVVAFESPVQFFNVGMALGCAAGETEIVLWRVDEYQYLMVPRSASTAPLMVSLFDAIDAVRSG